MQSGPLPTPDNLAKYEAVCPGAASRIITMAEAQSEHRRSLEAIAVPKTFEAQARGQRNGLIVSLTGFAVATVALLLDQEMAAAVIGGTTVVSLAGVFVYGRHSQAREREQNR